MTTNPLVICVAPNGARKTKADHPALPMGPAELGAEAAACQKAGAGAIHLHVRDAGGKHSLDPGRYREAIAEVRAQAPGLLIQATTEAVGLYAAPEQMAAVDALKPEAVSLALRELVPNESDEAGFRDFLARTRDAGAGIQFIVYAAEEAARLVDLQQRGILGTDAPHALFVLGRYTAGQRSDPRDLLPFLDPWPAEWPWTVCAFGGLETRCLATAIALGGHARVGFENNELRPDGSVAADNAVRVSDIAVVARDMGRPLGDAAAVRALYQAGV